MGFAFRQIIFHNLISWPRGVSGGATVRKRWYQEGRLVGEMTSATQFSINVRCVDKDSLALPPPQMEKF